MIFPLEVSDESHSSFGFGNIYVFFELIVLILEKHCNLVALLFLEVGLFFRTIRGWMTVFSTNRTFYVNSIFGLEGTRPSSMSFLLTILAIVFIDALNLLIVTFQKFFHFLVLIPV